MTSGRGYALLAGVADFYVASLTIGVAVGVYVAVSHSPIPVAATPAFIVLALMSAVVYHSRLARSVRWLSPGEQMHGRIIVGDVKEWRNPWLNNRWALFAANFLALVLLGNTWDGLSEVVITIPRVMTKTLYLVLVIAGVVLLGRGNALGVAGPILLYGSQWIGVRQLMHDANPPDDLTATTVALGGLAAVHIVVVGIYNFQRRRRMPAS